MTRVGEDSSYLSGARPIRSQLSLLAMGICVGARFPDPNRELLRLIMKVNVPISLARV